MSDLSNYPIIPPGVSDFRKAGAVPAGDWRAPEPEDVRLVPTHCCYCGVQCGMYLKVDREGRVFGVEPAAVTLDQRSKAKMVSYGLAYGMEAYGLGQRLNIATDEAAVILDAYFEAFPNVKAYMEATVVEARKVGYTETLFGRRRPIPELLDGNWRVRQAGERQAMNAGIQGLAADIFKVALVRIDEALEAGGCESEVVLQVHDEVIVEVPDAERDDVGPGEVVDALPPVGTTRLQRPAEPEQDLEQVLDGLRPLRLERGGGHATSVELDG